MADADFAPSPNVSLGNSGDSGKSSWSGSNVAAGTGLVGLGLGIYGTIQGIDAAKASAQASEDIAGLEQKVNDQRQLAMQIVARRQQMQTIRTSQQASATAQAAATNQGAGQGSGLSGGLASISGQSASNLLGTNQQLDIGNQIFGFDKQISDKKIAQYKAQSDQATSAGWTSFGASVLKSASSFGALAGG